MADDYDYLHELDPSFTDSAARMSSQIDELTKHKPIPGKVPAWEPGPLDGFTKAHFFEPVAAFSGQDLSLIEALYEVVSDVWLHCTDHMDEFNDGLLHVFSKWSGETAIRCSGYVGALKDFTTSEKDRLTKLAQGLVTYAAIIHAGRQNLRQLMDSCLDGWSQATHAGEVAQAGVWLTVLSTVAGGLAGVATGGSALPPFVNVVGAAITGASKQQLDLSGKHADIANKYLIAARNVVAQAVEGIDVRAIPQLNKVVENVQPLPTPPDVANHGTFYPESAEPQRLMTAGTSDKTGTDQPGKIGKTLD